jgi:hypothetical protein
MLALNAAINPVINSNIGNPPVPPSLSQGHKISAFQDGFVGPENGFIAQSLGGSIQNHRRHR